MGVAVAGQINGIAAWCTAVSKDTLQFPVDRPLPKALVRKLLKNRLDEIAAKKASTRPG